MDRVDTLVVELRTVEDLNRRRIETLKQFIPRGLIRKWSSGEMIIGRLNKSRLYRAARAINGVEVRVENIRPRGYQFAS